MTKTNIPVLLITFNRPNHTRRVLTSIIEAGVKDLFVFQDGARTDHDEDTLKCEEVRTVIRELTDETGITINTYFSKDNLGCGAGPMTGIDWFFSQVEEGIVMEDDCLPHPDFFGYCSELLERYRNDENVRFINATLYDDKWKCKASYDFSLYMVTGAWAGWRRTWEGFDLDLKDLDARAFRTDVLRLTRNLAEANWWYSIVKEIQQDERKKSYWDYQMQINLFRHNALTIHPGVNLISNIGFDGEGTHTLNNDDQRGERKSFSILPLSHPTGMPVDLERDAICWAKARSRGRIKDTINYWYQSLLWSNGLGHRLLMAYKKMKGSGINTKKV